MLVPLCLRSSGKVTEHMATGAVILDLGRAVDACWEVVRNLEWHQVMLIVAVVNKASRAAVVSGSFAAPSCLVVTPGRRRHPSTSAQSSPSSYLIIEGPSKSINSVNNF